MQAKGIVKFFLIVLTLVCLVQYLFIIPTRRIENAAEAHAQKVVANAAPADKDAALRIARSAYLDSMSSEKVLSIPYVKQYTYQDLKKQQLALGLDLKGGMSVVLQVDLKDFLTAMSNNSQDPAFQSALKNAAERQKNAQTDFVSLFAEEFQKVSGGKKLSSIFARNEGLKDKINFDTPDAAVVTLLRQKADETVDLTYKRLKDRIDEFGVTQPNVSLDKSRDLIVVELPGIDNPERARNFLQATAKLEFWEVYRVSDANVVSSFIEADDRLKKIAKGDSTLISSVDTATPKMDTTYTYKRDSLGNIVDSTMVVQKASDKTDMTKGLADKGPLLQVFSLNGTSGNQLSAPLAVMGTAEKNKMSLISEYLNKPEIRVLFPKDMDFRWSYKPTISQDGKTSYYELYAIKKRKNRDEAPLEGDRVTDAFSYPDPRSGQVLVSLKMDPQGARTWGDMTTKAAQDNNREIAIVLDNKVVSCPRVNDPILSGDSQISGTFTIDEGKDLASILQIGKLPAKTEIIQESLVGPSLGKDNINKSFNSIGIAFALLCIFMIFYYAGGGVVSVLAMLLNLFFLIGASASLGTVMTLPGIAGILLTLAVAVDTNVITYERIREELRHGKPLLQAIKDGFRLSSSAILDANVTTLLTAIVLNIYGLGPIKGFAIILIVGILTTLFTAMLVARLMIDYWTGKGNDIKFWRPFSQHFMENVNIDWMKYRKSAYIFSGILTLISLISIFTRGFDLGVDFKGGYSYTVQFDKDISIEKVRDALTKSFGSTPIVKVVDTKNTYNITTSYLVNDNSATAQSNVLKKLHEGIVAVDGNIDINEFTKAEGKGTHIISSSKVGSTIADDIQRSSFLSAGLASLLIFIYLLIRFSRWQFSMGAVLAVLHDLIITLGVFSLLRGIMPFSMEIDQALIAAILTVIGYSVNDTVIVFDRIREFLHTYAGKTKEEIFNVAINSTLSRTIITSGVTTFVCLILLIFGGGAIKGFAFALFIGIFFGTYSSVYIASAIAVDLMKDITPREVKAQVKETAKPAKA